VAVLSAHMGSDPVGPAGWQRRTPGRSAFVLSILPISLRYHLAHYLTTLLVNGQYAILSLNDPFARGWNLFGLEGRHVIVSFLADFDSVAIIWKLQAAAVVGGHILALASH
jgi:hypothetical protein